MTSHPEPGGVTNSLDSLLSSDALERIDEALKSREDPDSETHRSFEESRARWDEILKPQIDAIRDSEQLTQDDFAIRINTRD